MPLKADTSSMNTRPTDFLKHHLLIAMPQLADNHFANTLVYLVEHGEHGAMGLVVNRPMGLNLADVLPQLRSDWVPAEHCQDIPIFAGGPVHSERGFVLHSADHAYQSTIALGELSLSSSQDVLFAIADGQGPQHYLITLGYAGWDSGQLEQELLDNVWLTCPCEPQILFQTPVEQRLNAAAALLGVNLALLSAEAGHA